jgi:hypothetical protein
MKKELMIAAVLALIISGCEKPLLEDWGSVGDADGNVLLTVAANETRSVPVGEVCTRLNVAVFDSGGTKVKSVGQSSAESGFGNVRLSLPEGNYKLVVVGHNGTGSATITNVEKVTFPNNKVTDTFLYFGTLTVTGETQELAITLTRCVAMLRLILDDSGGDSDIASLKFYYLGGSSTLSPLSGYGCVNSKQTEYRAWNEDGVYELYTVPHTAADVLTRLTITAYDASDNVVGEWTLTDIPVTMNRVTEYSGDLFGGGGHSGDDIPTGGITVDAEWDGVDSYTF